jgi:hypothetical protein
VTLDTVSAEALTAEVVAAVEQARPGCLCVAALPPGGLAHTRYLIKRLRARFTEVCIIVGRWGVDGEGAHDAGPLTAAGATRVGLTLAETRDHILEVLPLTAPSTTSLPRSA